MKRRIVIRDLGVPFSIVQQPPKPGALGHFDERTGTVVIDPDQPEVGKHIVLLHEFLHAVDTQLILTGITRRRADHRWIASAAPNLLALLVLSGMYTGVRRRELLAFMRGMKGPPERRARLHAGDGRRR